LLVVTGWGRNDGCAHWIAFTGSMGSAGP
jgi:hypothetical protein